jgi:hypothetical protein
MQEKKAVETKQCSLFRKAIISYLPFSLLRTTNLSFLPSLLPAKEASHCSAARKGKKEVRRGESSKQVHL